MHVKKICLNIHDDEVDLSVEKLDNYTLSLPNLPVLVAACCDES